jgi:hypothetical protein
MGIRLSLAQMAENETFADAYDLLEEYANETVVPACCSDGCQVEPDGHCPHGHPSIFLAAGVI